jgi:hypothetical protein
MKPRIVCLCILASMVGLLLFLGAGVSQSASPPKATGGVWFTTIESGEEVQHRVEFQVHEENGGQPDKGWLSHRDSDGNWIRVDVDCVTIYGDHAFFSGVIVSASDDGQVGNWLLVAVQDGGSPGTNGDHVWGEMYDYDPGCAAGTFPPGGPWDVEKGNLVVHPGTD